MLKGKIGQIHFIIAVQEINRKGDKTANICADSQEPDSLAASLLAAIHVLLLHKGTPSRDVRKEERMMTYEVHLYK